MELRIAILEVGTISQSAPIERSNSSIPVRFTSVFGLGRLGPVNGVWRSEEIPEVGNEYEVEVGIPESLVWGKTLTISDGQTLEMWEEAGHVMITGRVDLVHDDDTLSVTLLGKATIVVGLEGISPDLTGRFVLMRVPSLDLWPGSDYSIA